MAERDGRSAKPNSANGGSASHGHRRPLTMAVGDLMFEVGIVMLVAFVGAALASRFRLSVTIGYVVAGILIGPHVSVTLLGHSYTGLVRDTTFVDQLSYFGLILLLFFVGLQFPLSKLRATKNAAAILAVMNVGMNMFGGFVIGTHLGWPLIDTIFLAGIISMSSSALMAKVLMDLKRLGGAETQFLVSMVVLESFIAMFLLTAMNGLVISSSTESVSLHILFLGIVVFIGFFAFLAAFVIPRASRHFEKIESDELFILFALGMVFMAAAMAEVLHIPAVIGAFFIGISFANTKLVKRFEHKLTGLRDAFVAVFFISFGMMIDPSAIPNVLYIVMLAVPLIFLVDLFLTATLAYFIGFNGKSATAIGTSLLGRNEEAILYASVGTKAITSNPAINQTYGGALLNPFAGVLCIVTSSVAPICMKHYERIAGFFGRHIPGFLVFGGDLVKRTLKTSVMPSYLPLYRRTRGLVASLVAVLVLAVSLMMTQGYVHVAVAMMIPAIVYAFRYAAKNAFEEPSKHTNYGIEHSPAQSDAILKFVLRIVVGAILAICLVAFLWQYLWQATLIVLLGYFVGVVVSMKIAYNSLFLRKTSLVMPVLVDSKMRAHKREWRPVRRAYNGRHK